MDFTVSNHGSIFLLTPHSGAAEEWIEEHIVGDEHMFLGRALAVEHRFISDIVEGIQAGGLEVS